MNTHNRSALTLLFNKIFAVLLRVLLWLVVLVVCFYGLIFGAMLIEGIHKGYYYQKQANWQVVYPNKDDKFELKITK